uniref:MULE transposase domain-containing protein n=1 Tax=Plectus sambesii TaxID=2011161 RepID=A0A914VF88_9BILA
MPRFKKNWRLADRFNSFEDLKKVLEEKKVHKRSTKKQNCVFTKADVNSVAYKKRKLEGPPIRTRGALFEEISSWFPEGSAASPPDSVIHAHLDCDTDNPNAFYTFLMTQRLLLNLGKPGGDVLQVDGTYKLMYEESTVLTLGISDRHRRLHPVGIAIISQAESTTAYIKLFECLQEALRQSGLPEYWPSAVMSDGDPSITRAVSEVFPTALHLTCFFI